jgi:hypothetical protein
VTRPNEIVLDRGKLGLAPVEETTKGVYLLRKPSPRGVGTVVLEAMGVTGFTLPTLYRWVRSDRGRLASLYPFRNGRFLGSGQGNMVLSEAGLDGESQYRAIRDYLMRRN